MNLTAASTHQKYQSAGRQTREKTKTHRDKIPKSGGRSAALRLTRWRPGAGAGSPVQLASGGTAGAPAAASAARAAAMSRSILKGFASTRDAPSFCAMVR